MKNPDNIIKLGYFLKDFRDLQERYNNLEEIDKVKLRLVICTHLKSGEDLNVVEAMCEMLS